MINSNPKEAEIQTFIDAGTSTVGSYNYVSNDLRGQLTTLKTRADNMMTAAAVPSGDGDTEKPVQFRLNQTGNIFYSTTSDKIEGDTKKLFDSVTVLFAAMTTALSQKGKDLFDYDAWSSIISKSGFFVNVQKFITQLTIQSTSVTIDTQIIQQLLPGLVTGNSLEIAKSVLSAISGTYSSGSRDENSKIGHLMFICEELFGAPSVTVRLFYATKKSHEATFDSPCVKVATKSFDQMQEADTFLFVDPSTIAEFAGKFGEQPESYKTLIEKLAGYVDSAPESVDQ